MTNRSISRRDFLKTTATGAGAVILAACTAPQPTQAPAGGEGTEPTSVPAATGPVTIQVLWNNWGENYNNLMKVIGDEYTKVNPNVTVEWTFDGEWKTKLLTQVAGGTPPDSTYTNLDAQATLAEKNTFMALDNYLSASGLKRDDFVIAMYDAGLWEGKLFSLPGGVDWIAVVWNKDVYKEAGLDPEKPPVTYDEWLEHSRAINKFDDAGNLERVGFTGGIDNYFRNVLLNNGSFWDADNEKVTAADPTNVSSMEYIHDYIKEVDINKLAAFNARPDMYQAGSAFSTNQAAYQVDGFWVYDVLDKYCPDIDYGVMLYPIINSGKEEERSNYMLGGWMVSIPTGAKYAQEGWDFMKYAFIDEAAKMGYQTLNGPCVPKTYPDFIKGMTEILGADNRMSPYLEVFTKTGELGQKTWPVMRVNAFYRDEETRIYDFIMRDEMTAQEGLTEVQTNVQAEYDKGA